MIRVQTIGIIMENAKTYYIHMNCLRSLQSNYLIIDQ